jgi:hypothetical protein
VHKSHKVNDVRNSANVGDVSEVIKRLDKFTTQQQELVSWIKGMDNKLVSLQKNVEEQTYKVKAFTERLPGQRGTSALSYFS